MKKYIIILFFIFVFSVGLLRVQSMSLLGKIIYLDPGHGGKDPGAIYKNVFEADINLDICFKLKDALEKQGAVVYMTRYGDYDLSSNNVSLRKRSDLSERARIINESSADMYISIHLNASSDSTWHGAQVFYTNTNKENEKIAQILQEQLKKDLGSNRNYKLITTSYMHNRVKIKGILAEIGFITNSNERNLLLQDDYQEKIISSIIKGIMAYFPK